MLQENEMREFFQRVIDNVAELSTQAHRVEGLEQRINELSDRLRAVEEENYNLRTQLNDAVNQQRETSEKLDATRRDYDSEMSVSRGLRETIIERDYRVANLTEELAQERDSHTATQRERDEAKGQVGDLQALVQSLRDQLAASAERENTFQTRAVDAEHRVTELQAKLDRVMRVLNPEPSLQAVS
jgi:chromosome segregation ATPase